jgi:dienelactone hydrolase
MGKSIVPALLALLLATPLQAQIREEPVTYKAGDVEMRGLIYYDEARKERRPGVLVVHEWWGITKHVRDSARELAQMGYTALAVDMFGEGRTAADPKTAGALAGSVRKDPAVMHARFDAAHQVLLKHPTVDPSRVAAIGYCFGGSVALDQARRGADLAGVIAFHAGLAPAQPASGPIKARILVLNGADDPLVKPESVEAFKKEMDAAKANYRFVNYPGAVHAFTNPEATEAGRKFNMPVAYHAEADRQSKAEMRKFLAEVFDRK